MATLRVRRRAGRSGDVRAELAEYLRAALADRRYRDPRTERLIERLDDGEPVELCGWQIRRWHPEFRHIPLVRIDPDGSVSPVEATTTRRELLTQ